MKPPLRCVLFVPGNRPERFSKAMASGADAVAIDLEDAVALASKGAARAAAMAALCGPRAGSARLGLRINPLVTETGRADLAELAISEFAPDFLMLPKFERADELQVVREMLGARACALIPLVETARGLLDLDRALAASPPVSAVMLGGYDLAVDLGARFAFEPLLYARQHLRMVTAAYGIDVIDVPYVDIADLAGLAAETTRVIGLGYTGKAAIHPAQVAPIQDAFLPDAAQFAAAERVLAAAQCAGGEAVQVDGRLIDLPVVLAARRLVALAQFGLRPDANVANDHPA